MDNYWGDEEVLEIKQNDQPQDDLKEEIEEQYIDEIIHETTDNDDSSDVSERTLNAIRQIEQAKLYESLLKHDFFAPGSARQEIQHIVTVEIRDFILQRLEALLGINNKSEKSQQPVQQQVFRDDEILALKALSNRLLDKTKTKAQNTQSPTPKVQQYNNPSEDISINTAKPSEPIIQKVEKKQEPSISVKKRKKRIQKKIEKKKESEFQLKGNYQKAVINKAKPPKKMPTQSTINNLNAQQVQNNLSALNQGDQAVNMAIKLAQMNNK